MQSHRLVSLALAAPAALALAACQLPHYSSAVVRGPTHITYVQNDSAGDEPASYLVDCPIGPDEQAVNCQVVPLEKKRAR